MVTEKTCRLLVLKAKPGWDDIFTTSVQACLFLLAVTEKHSSWETGFISHDRG